VTYCVQESLKNHCLWLLDEKLQVWKCTNELNPNSCNWTLRKITMLDNLKFRRFLQPAMTFEDFYDTTSLNGIECLGSIAEKNAKQNEVLYAFNGTTLKCLVVKQPVIRN